VRNDANLRFGAGATVGKQPQRRVGHHDHEIGVAAERLEHARLVPRRQREDGVQGQDERLGELFRQREDVLAVATAEDAVLVLEENHVDVAPSEDARRADVVAAGCLGDRRDQTGPLRPRRVVHHDDLRDRCDLVEAVQ